MIEDPEDTSPTPQSDRSDLRGLYPTAKTYDEKAREEKLRQLAVRGQWPRHPSLNIAIFGSFVAAFIVWVAQNIQSWWSSSAEWGTLMSAVFFSFAVMLVAVLSFVIWTKYVSRLFDYFGGKVALFWLLYGISVLLMLVVWVGNSTVEYTSLTWIPILAVIHFAAVIVIARYTINSSKN